MSQIHALRERLLDPTVTPAEMQQYTALINASAVQNNLLHLPDLNWFVDDNMLLDYWRACDWWPRDLPAHPCPTLPDLAMQAGYLHGQQPKRLCDLLAEAGARCADALVAANRCVVNPNESWEARQKRLNKERVNRHRERKKAQAGEVPATGDSGAAVAAGTGDGVPVREPAGTAAVRAATENLAALKAARNAELEQIDAWVKEAHQEMLRRADVRKAQREHWALQIAEAERVLRDAR
jgi:hypothetical protein